MNSFDDFDLLKKSWFTNNSLLFFLSFLIHNYKTQTLLKMKVWPPTLWVYEPSPKLRVSHWMLLIMYLYFPQTVKHKENRACATILKSVCIFLCICLSIRKSVLPHSILHIFMHIITSFSINIFRNTLGIIKKRRISFSTSVCVANGIAAVAVAMIVLVDVSMDVLAI